MNQRVIVARALSEVLKIVGALGVVNVFTLAMMNRLLFKRIGPADEPAGVLNLEHYQIEPQVRDLMEPNLAIVVSGLALIFMFVRFVYGSIILLDGDYVSQQSPFKNIQGSDVFSIGSLLLIFPILSFYGGAGQLGNFSVFLLAALAVDAVAMHYGKDEANEKSLYIPFRKSWTHINFWTAAGFFLTLFAFFIAERGGYKMKFDEVGFVFTVLYCVASGWDLVSNREFYLGQRNLEQAAAATGAATPAATQHQSGSS